MKKLKHWIWKWRLARVSNKEVDTEFEALELMEKFDPGFNAHYLEHSPLPHYSFPKDLRNAVHANFGYENTVQAWLDTRTTLNTIRAILLSCTYDTFDVCKMYPYSKWLKQDDFFAEVKRQLAEQQQKENENHTGS